MKIKLHLLIPRAYRRAALEELFWYKSLNRLARASGFKTYWTRAEIRREIVTKYGY